MDVTVAICTYRRPALLRTTLQSLRDCARPAGAWEVLVVDNAAEAEAAHIVAELAPALPLRYVAEGQVGTSFARNRAVREAGAPVVLFTDDDVTFHPQWLSRMDRAIVEHPECEFWGGRVEPVWSAPGGPTVKGPWPPPWFDQARCPMLGDAIVQYRRGDQPRFWDAQQDPPFYTANLALRTEAVRAAGLFDTRVGHRGARRMGMEDSLMVRAIAAAGGRGWYAADAVVYHPVPAERVTRRYARSFAWRQGWLATQLLRRESPADRVPRWLYRAAAGRMLRGLGQWVGRGLCADSPGAFAGQMEALFNFSKLWHAGRGPARRATDPRRSGSGPAG